MSLAIDYDIFGDIKSGTKEIRYQGNFTESSFVDVDGNIYHLIALDDGAVLRRIECMSE